MKDILYKYGLIHLLLLTYNITYANNYKPLTTEQFEELSSQIDYTKDTKRKISLKEFENKSEEKDDTPFQLVGLGSLFGFINILAYLLIILLIGVILYFLINSIEYKDQKIMYEEKPIEEEDIEDIDAQNLYQIALGNKDYRTAIRMRFILVLQDFTEKQLINWQPEKTNRDYKRELRTTDQYRFFESASNIYDRIWYGNEQVSAEVFQNLNPYFELNPSV